jgi:hypothetical protein
MCNGGTIPNFPSVEPDVKRDDVEWIAKYIVETHLRPIVREEIRRVLDELPDD